MTCCGFTVHRPTGTLIRFLTLVPEGGLPAIRCLPALRSATTPGTP